MKRTTMKHVSPVMTFMRGYAAGYNAKLRDSDTRRMAETGNTDSVRSTGSAGPQDIAQNTPSAHPSGEQTND